MNKNGHLHVAKLHGLLIHPEISSSVAGDSCTGGHKALEVIPKAALSNHLQQTSSKAEMDNDT